MTRAFVLLGPPGSGKGTLCKLLRGDFPSLSVISTGDIMRRNAQTDQIKSGDLVSDEIVTAEIKKALIRCSDNVVFDGYPRTLVQAQALMSMANVAAVFGLKVPHEILADRFAKRWIHPASGRIYHLDYAPPKTAGRDDETSEPLVRREDDISTTVIQHRLEMYRKTTMEPLFKHYSEQKLFYPITGRTTNELYLLIKPIIESKIN